ncbi:rhomboid family intramembrane serine protease [Alistipes indistinctus]|jgi:membrane associated rhomboid family serine protease|uniref:rhomboid family intramembrane serine protease n=1 Tax=Alistipes indistinctus TaxID=626932 RepID=UPI0015F1F8E3|nr:rhomboid family intramembrane serine protease [Alistipes indistinctus]BCG54765.1 rhomboid family intramembrane serine protease [Alistipes indistinctus]
MRFNNGAFTTPPVVKNLIIINALFFLAEVILPNGLGDLLIDKLGLYPWQSPNFRLYQLITHMFLHGGIAHLFMNMFALWMFGRTLEYDMGSKRFLIYYMITGIGAGLLQMGVSWIEISRLQAAAHEMGAMTPDMQSMIAVRANVVTIGASGAVFGVLLAFGMMYPNAMIMLLIPPIPIKAKYFVIGYGLLELSLGFTGAQSGVAHFAHVGGMIFGFFLLYYWKKKGKIYY